MGIIFIQIIKVILISAEHQGSSLRVQLGLDHPQAGPLHRHGAVYMLS